MFWIISFILSWLVWLMFANKNRWKEIMPVCIFASWLSFILESWMHYVYTLWSYTELPILSLLGNGFGVYIVVPYFFIQLLPHKPALKTMLVYFFLWSNFAIIFEFFHWYLLKIEYHLWWNIGYSYLADWLLFWIFYKFYVGTDLEKKSK